MRRRVLASLVKSGYTAKDYSQDGLIAMWDGIENAGWGVHDPNATVWKDLTGNGYDLSVGSAVFGDDNLSCASGYASFAEKIASSFVEIVCEGISSGVVLCGVGVAKAFRSLSEFEFSQQTMFNGEFGGVHLFSTPNNKGGVPYLDGTKKSQSPRSTSYSDGGYFEIGGRNGGTNRYYGRVFSIRLYSTVISSDAISENYAIDKARFGLT